MTDPADNGTYLPFLERDDRTVHAPLALLDIQRSYAFHRQCRRHRYMCTICLGVQLCVSIVQAQSQIMVARLERQEQKRHRIAL